MVVPAVPSDSMLVAMSSSVMVNRPFFTVSSVTTSVAWALISSICSSRLRLRSLPYCSTASLAPSSGLLSASVHPRTSALRNALSLSRSSSIDCCATVKVSVTSGRPWSAKANCTVWKPLPWSRIGSLVR